MARRLQILRMTESRPGLRKGSCLARDQALTPAGVADGERASPANCTRKLRKLLPSPSRLAVRLAPLVRLLHGCSCSGDAIGERRTFRWTSSPPRKWGSRTGGRRDPSASRALSGICRSGEGPRPPKPRHRPSRAAFGAPGPLHGPGWTSSKPADRPAPRFTRGGVRSNAPRRRRRQIIVPALPATEAPRITCGGAAGMRVIASHLRRAGPHPASLSSRPTRRAQSGAVPRYPAAHRSSVLNDQAHADRRHPRGRNPRGGAGR